jgi:hypothetical protein
MKNCLYYHGAKTPCNIKNCQCLNKKTGLCNSQGQLEYDALDKSKAVLNYDETTLKLINLGN